MDYRRFAACIEQILPSHVPIENINDLRWMNYILTAAKARFAPETELDISGCGQKVKQIIWDHLTTLGVKDWIAPIEISDPDFKKIISSLGSDEGEAKALESTSRHIITVKIDDNPAFYTSLLEKLQKILADTKNDWVPRKKMLEEYLETEVKEDETAQAESLGLGHQGIFVLCDHQG